MYIHNKNKTCFCEKGNKQDATFSRAHRKNEPKFCIGSMLLIVAGFFSFILLINYLEKYNLLMGLFISFIYRLICSPFAEALQVHVNPHVHVVYAAFCVYKINLAYNLRNGRNYVWKQLKGNFFLRYTKTYATNHFFLGMMSSRTPFYR